MGRAGFEPTKALPAELQSAPFGHFGISPIYFLLRKNYSFEQFPIMQITLEDSIFCTLTNRYHFRQQKNVCLYSTLRAKINFLISRGKIRKLARGLSARGGCASGAESPIPVGWRSSMEEHAQPLLNSKAGERTLRQRRMRLWRRTSNPGRLA
jgi:hypothetical protein